MNATGANVDEKLSTKGEIVQRLGTLQGMANEVRLQAEQADRKLLPQLPSECGDKAAGMPSCEDFTGMLLQIIDDVSRELSIAEDSLRRINREFD